jgi:hypothetical protein
MIAPEDIRFGPELAERAAGTAMKLFRLRQGRNLYIDVNPAWERLVEHNYQRALRNEPGATEQEQCIMQGIRLAIWESGQIPAPWSKAFPLPYVEQRPVSLPIRWRDRLLSWYRQARDAWRRWRAK